MARSAEKRGRGDHAGSLSVRSFGGPLLISPMAFWMLAFFLVPLLFIFAYSFGSQGIYEQGVHLSFQTVLNDVRSDYSVQSFHWYKEIFVGPQSSIYRDALVRTALMVVGNTLACLLIGYPLAYFISRKTGRRKTLFLLLVMIPFWTSFLIRTYAWMTILNDQGLLNSWLSKLHLVDPSHPLQLWPSMTAVWIVLIYGYLPFMVLPLFVSIEKIPQSLIEASKDLGASKWTTFRRVTLPLSVPGILAGCVLVAIPTTGEFVIPVIAGGDKVATWGWLIYRAFTASMGQWPLGAALSNVLLAVMMIVVVLYVVELGREAAR